MGEECKNCKYFEAYAAHTEKGECRRNAPIPGVFHADVDNAGQAAWPIVYQFFWCGEIERK